MDICHLKNAELEAKHQKYKGQVVLRGDILKDDSGSYAVFIEQGFSASQMTAVKIMDIISRLRRSSRSSWAESVRSSFGRTTMAKAIWENPIETRLLESF